MGSGVHSPPWPPGLPAHTGIVCSGRPRVGVYAGLGAGRFWVFCAAVEGLGHPGFGDGPGMISVHGVFGRVYRPACMVIEPIGRLGLVSFARYRVSTPSLLT